MKLNSVLPKRNLKYKWQHNENKTYIWQRWLYSCIWWKLEYVRLSDQQQVWQSALISQLPVGVYLLVFGCVISSPWGTLVQIMWWIQYVLVAWVLFGSWGRSTARHIRRCGGNIQSEKIEVQKSHCMQKRSETFWGIYSVKTFPNSSGILPREVVWMPKAALIHNCGSFLCK